MIGSRELEREALLQPWGSFHSLDALVTELECLGMLSRIDTLLRQKGEIPDEAEIEDDADQHTEHGSPWLRSYENELAVIFLQSYWDTMENALSKFRYELAPGNVTRAYIEFDNAIDKMRVISPEVKKETKAKIAEIMEAGYEKGADGKADNTYLAATGRLIVQDGLYASLEHYLREFFYRFVAPKVRDELDVVFDVNDSQKEPVTKKVLALLLSPSYVSAYMVILANVVAQRGFNYGYLTGAQGRGVRVYRFCAIIDNRTSAICRSLNGTEFFVSDALRLIERASNPQNPTAATTITPWLRAETIEPMSVQQLVQAGVMVPPLHANCRSHLEEVVSSI